jgi:hypothetical protein
MPGSLRRHHGLPSVSLALIVLSTRFAHAGQSSAPDTDATSPAQVNGVQESRYSAQPSFSADEFWATVSGLLNRQNGFITKEQFEHAFHVTFGPALRERDATTYLLDAGKSWYFGASLVLHVAVPANPFLQFSGTYTGWHIDWSRGVFANTGKHRCVTADMVRTDLLRTGWTSPWPQWGLWEELARKTAEDMARNAPPGGYPYPEPALMPRAVFRRSSDESKGLRDVLPQGEFYTQGQVAGVGDSPDSCVVAIHVDAADDGQIVRSK